MSHANLHQGCKVKMSSMDLSLAPILYRPQKQTLIFTATLVMYCHNTRFRGQGGLDTSGYVFFIARWPGSRGEQATQRSAAETTPGPIQDRDAANIRVPRSDYQGTILKMVVDP